MPNAPALPRARAQSHDLQRALRLVTFSVVFGLGSGAVSVTTGLHDHSLGVFAVGLGVLADVTGSATLIWRFGAEISDPARSGRRERQSAVAVSLALAVTAVVLAAESAIALAQRSQPAASAVTLTAASLSLLVLTPLAIAKRRVGAKLTSRALQGDGALSGIGAATSFLAITALVLYQLVGWWWADRVTALVVAGVAGREAWRTVARRHSGSAAVGDRAVVAEPGTSGACPGHEHRGPAGADRDGGG